MGLPSISGNLLTLGEYLASRVLPPNVEVTTSTFPDYLAVRTQPVILMLLVIHMRLWFGTEWHKEGGSE